MFPFQNQALGSPGHLNESTQHPCFCELPEQDQRQAGRSWWPGGEMDSKTLGQHLDIYSRSWRVTAWREQTQLSRSWLLRLLHMTQSKCQDEDSHTTRNPENITADFISLKTMGLAPYKCMMTTPSSWQEPIHGELTLSFTEFLFFLVCGRCMVFFMWLQRKSRADTHLWTNMCVARLGYSSLS